MAVGSGANLMTTCRSRMFRVKLHNRRRNSGKQHEGKRFPSHLAWLRKRPCIIEGLYGHLCSGRMEAAHVDAAGGKGMGVKVADYHAVPACSEAHRLIHSGAESFERKYGLSLIEAGKQYAKASPHRHLWEVTND